MKTFYNCVVHPRDEEECPTGQNDCNGCEYLDYIGTFGGDFYVQCTYGENEEND